MMTDDVATADLAELARLVGAIALRLAALGASAPRPEPLPLQTPPARQLEDTDEDDDSDDVAGNASEPAAMSPEEFRRLRREWASMTQHEAARVLNVTPRTVVRWEGGATKINAFMAARARSIFVKTGEGLRTGGPGQAPTSESVS